MANKKIIIGAGVIGASIALALQKDGHDVTLIDRDGPCSGASSGNAGAIVNGACAPSAMPGNIIDAMRMLTKAHSTHSIRPAYFHKILPWLFRSLLQSRSSRVNENAKNLHALSQHAVSSWQELIGQSELFSLFRETGWLKVYESEKTFDHTKNFRKLLDTHGTPYEVLNASQIHDLEPNLAPIFTHGLYQKESLSISDPEQLVKGMVELFVKQGGTFTQFDVDQITIQDDAVQLKGQSEKLSADQVVIATGAWSGDLAKQLGEKISLDTERGYHLMLPNGTQSLLKRPVLHGDSYLVLAPMEAGMRLAAQSEFGGLKLAADYRTIRNFLGQAKRMLPDMDCQEESVWMGFRPSLPDSLPVLGFSSRSDKVLYAFGHQHLGMTLAAITGQLVADLISNREPPIELAPYRANRF